MSNLKAIADGYFSSRGIKPKKSYTEAQLVVIRDYLAKLVGEIRMQEAADFAYSTAAVYGVDPVDFYKYISSNPEYFKEATSADNLESGDPVEAIQNGLGAILKPVKWLANEVGDLVGGVAGNILKKILAPLIIAGVVGVGGYIVYRSITNKQKKS